MLSKYVPVEVHVDVHVAFMSSKYVHVDIHVDVHVVLMQSKYVHVVSLMTFIVKKWFMWAFVEWFIWPKMGHVVVKCSR